MKILCLSDFHIDHKDGFKQYKSFIDGLLQEYNPEVVVITGDIFEPYYKVNPYKKLHELISDRKVICTLGNHEFLGKTVEETLTEYKHLYCPDQYDIHYLDIVEYINIGNYHFVGNVLWYDGSMKCLPNQDLNTFADGAWADKDIKKFDWVSECSKCKDAIIRNQGEDWTINILCTHTCPHILLNAHQIKIRNPFNAFSGVADFLNSVKFDYAICGHTHLRVVGEMIGDCRCINVGNDYHPPFKYFLLDI